MRWEVGVPGCTSLAPPAPQLEKVLQQGDISECCEPYMVMKEVDTAKVSKWRLRGVVKGSPGRAGPGFSRPGALSGWGMCVGGVPTEQREAGEAAPGGRAVLHPPGPLPHALRLDGGAPGQHREQRWAARPGLLGLRGG